MLINMQRPDATLVAAYGKWKQLGRHINKGETGIAIFAPTPYKTNEYIETQKPAYDEYGNQLYNEDGTEKMETIETPLTGMAFKTVYVFDVSQTDGKELPEPVSELTGDVDAARKDAIFTAIKKVTGIDVEFQDIKGGSKGYYSPASDTIVIKTGMSDAQTLKTVFHETAHKLLHDPKSEIVTVKSPRNEKEVQAESVAFMVAEKFGIDTSEYSFPYIASWSEGKQLEQLKNALQEIQSAAKQISNAIESELLKMQKGHSLSVSDVVVLEDKAYYVDDVGFKPLEDFIPLEVKQSRFYDELPKRLSYIAEGKVSPLQDNLLKVGNDALRLNVPPYIMREAAFRSGDERVQKLADTYEKMCERKSSAPAHEKPKLDERKPQRKLKL